MPDFYEFFAGGGMVRAGLGPNWRCLFANDFDPKKAKAYAANWGSAEIKVGDVAKLKSSELPKAPELAWASFPCQDLSLAGGGAGLKGERSGTFWAFWKLTLSLRKEGRAPKVIALENVCGALTSHDGKDFAEICSALKRGGYHFGALVIDAAYFVPQSRPRLFFIAVRDDVAIPPALNGMAPDGSPWHTAGLQTAVAKLPASLQADFIWWRLPMPPTRNTGFAELIEENPSSVPWHTREETNRILEMMSEINIIKVGQAKKAGRLMVGGIYKRTRKDEKGHKLQRAEVRFDDVSGCLRTPSGGSSRQVIMVVKGGVVKTRLISSRETARLMGLPDEYRLPDNYNEAYHLTGDGVVVPVVRHLAENIFERILLTRLAARPRVAA
jgi:DNA (cytosine-5)-methyltransferase 1